MIQKFESKKVVIEAIQFDGKNGLEIEKWSEGKVKESPVLEENSEELVEVYLQVETLEGIMLGNVGDFVIKGLEGEFYPCKPSIFEKKYQKPKPEKPKESKIDAVVRLLKELKDEVPGAEIETLAQINFTLGDIEHCRKMLYALEIKKSNAAEKKI